ncbi:large ribosomal subunit protein mL55 [Phymastichus coffea]|uniref:large ribosomal subunit protein mL55 n=1 Tax=Phymastichus coffea TaxID=108790 RepID=UPI00273B98A2|nr:large ribosomal subunit protein mL55 [Phymastichus coffea]
MTSKLSPLLKFHPVIKLYSRHLTFWPETLTKKSQRLYTKAYPTTLQFPDGSTITIPYPEQIGVIKLPLDLSTLSEEERKARLMKRIPKTKIVIQEEIEDDFDESRYLKFRQK